MSERFQVGDRVIFSREGERDAGVVESVRFAPGGRVYGYYVRLDRDDSNPWGASFAFVGELEPEEGDGHYHYEDEIELAPHAEGPEALRDRNVEDAVSPDHYDFPGGVQVIDITKHLSFLDGNVVKYVARAGRKGDRYEDLLKARKYLDWAIEIEEARR